MERLDLAVKVDLPPERFPAEIEASAYFIVAEALTNIVKHARAESAAVSATVHDGMLELEVRDDGIGGADPGGHGLVGLNDRVTALARAAQRPQPGGQRHGPDRHPADLPRRRRHRVANSADHANCVTTSHPSRRDDRR